MIFKRLVIKQFTCGAQNGVLEFRRLQHDGLSPQAKDEHFG